MFSPANLSLFMTYALTLNSKFSYNVELGELHSLNCHILLHTYTYIIAICVCVLNILLNLYDQGCSKVFTTSQATVNPEHYVIECVGGR